MLAWKETWQFQRKAGYIGIHVHMYMYICVYVHVYIIQNKVYNLCFRYFMNEKSVAVLDLNDEYADMNSLNCSKLISHSGDGFWYYNYMLMVGVVWSS